MSTLKRLLACSRPHLAYIILSMVCGLIQVLSQLAAPIFMGRAIDYIKDAATVDLTTVTFYLLFMAGAVLLVLIFQYLMNLFATIAANKTIRDIQTDMFRKLNRVPLRETDKFSVGNLLSRITADTQKISDGLIQGFTQLFAGVALIAGTLTLMIIINVYVALVVMLLTPLSVFVAYFIAKSGQKMFMQEARAVGELSGLSEEYITHQKLIKLFNYEAGAEQEFEDINNQIKKYGKNAVFISALVNPSTRLVNGFVYASVCLASAFLLIRTSTALTVGALSTFLSFSLQYAKPFNEITAVITDMQAALISARRVFEILDLPDESDDSLLAPLKNVEGATQFDDVSFSYTDKPFIEGLNLDVSAGSSVAIVGKTGCGKTTLISLLMRFYERDGGRILIDGVDTSEVRRSSLRSNIGMVLQDTWLFDGTIRENIAYSNPDATMEQIECAAKRARIHGFIMRLEKQYDTKIAAYSLSQGQMQLISIARVFLALPPILILDEATSSIDARTELKIQEAFKEMMVGHTSFIVAHRLSTIRNADMIVVMDAGRVVEQGTHEQLKDAGGEYSKLLQAAQAGTNQDE